MFFSLTIIRWWRSLLCAGVPTAAYVLLYSIVYFARLQSDLWVTYVLYFAYMSIIAAAVFLITGTVGFFACFYFNYQIYASIKVD